MSERYVLIQWGGGGGEWRVFVARQWPSMVFVLGAFVPGVLGSGVKYLVPYGHLSDAISQTYSLRFRSLGPPHNVAKFQLEDDEGIGVGGVIGYYCCRDDDGGCIICRQEGLQL